VHHINMHIAYRAIVGVLKTRPTVEVRIRSVDWLIGRLFQLRAQLAAGQWPPTFDEQEDERRGGTRRTGRKPRARR
jgi:hypothetical protein